MSNSNNNSNNNSKPATTTTTGIFVNKPIQSSFPAPGTPSRRLSVSGAFSSIKMQQGSAIKRRESNIYSSGIPNSTSAISTTPSLLSNSGSTGSFRTPVLPSFSTPAKSHVGNRRLSMMSHGSSGGVLSNSNITGLSISTPLYSTLTSSGSSMVGNVTSTFYDMKKKEEELNSRIEQLEKELESERDEKSGLVLKIKEHVDQIQECENKWRNKCDELVTSITNQLKQEKESNEVYSEKIQALERKMNHLSDINHKYAAKLESLGIFIADLNEIQPSEVDMANRDQKQNIFYEEINKVQSALQLSKQASDEQLNLLKEKQNDLDVLMKEFNPQTVESDIGLDHNHLCFLKQKFAQLRRGKKMGHDNKISKQSKCHDLLRPCSRPLEVEFAQVEQIVPETNNM